MRAVYFGTYDEDYPRNRIMIAGLRSAGVVVTECHHRLWRNTDEKVAAATRAGTWFSLVRRAILAYAFLLISCWRLRRSYDVMMLGYTGQFDVFFARLLSWLDRRPLVLDVLMSIHLIASERRLPYRKLLRWVEGIALRIPDMLIIDTPENGEWFENFYGISRSRFRLVPIGADNRYFRPVTGSPSNNVFRVVYHGSFLPLHGVEHIVQAAALLREHQDIHFDLVGDGPMRKAAQSLARRLQVSQVDFPGWIDHRLLLSQMASADVLLGVFGTTEMAKRTIQNKIYEGLAMARPVISADGPAVRRVFTHREHAYLVESANPEALANAILTLRSKPCLRAHLAETGYHLFMEKFSVEAVGKVARGHLERLLDPSSSAPETAQARLTI